MLPYLYKCLQCTYFVKKQIRNQKSLKEMSRIRILPFFPPTKQVSYLCCRAKLLPNQPTKPNNTHKRQSCPSVPSVCCPSPHNLLVRPCVVVVITYTPTPLSRRMADGILSPLPPPPPPPPARSGPSLFATIYFY